MQAGVLLSHGFNVPPRSAQCHCLAVPAELACCVLTKGLIENFNTSLEVLLVKLQKCQPTRFCQLHRNIELRVVPRHWPPSGRFHVKNKSTQTYLQIENLHGGANLLPRIQPKRSCSVTALAYSFGTDPTKAPKELTTNLNGQL